jgi:hypothetical protein
MWVKGVLQRIIQGIKNITLTLEYIFSLKLFIVYNSDYFVSYSVYHNNNTAKRNGSHLPKVPLPMYQKAVYYSDITICNSLPKAIKDTCS